MTTLQHSLLFCIDRTNQPFVDQRGIFLDNGQGRAKLVGDVVDELLRGAIEPRQTAVLALEQPLAFLQPSQQPEILARRALTLDRAVNRTTQYVRIDLVLGHVVLGATLQRQHRRRPFNGRGQHHDRSLRHMGTERRDRSHRLAVGQCQVGQNNVERLRIETLDRLGQSSDPAKFLEVTRANERLPHKLRVPVVVFDQQDTPRNLAWQRLNHANASK